MQSPAEGIKDKPDILQCDDPEKRIITRFPKDDGTMTITRIKCDMALGHCAFNFAPVGEGERQRTFRNNADRLPMAAACTSPRYRPENLMFAAPSGHLHCPRYM